MSVPGAPAAESVPPAASASPTAGNELFTRTSSSWDVFAAQFLFGAHCAQSRAGEGAALDVLEQSAGDDTRRVPRPSTR